VQDSTGPFRVVFTQAGGRAGRVVSFAQRQPGWVTRAAAWALILATLALAAIVIIPLMVLALAAFLVLALIGWARSLFAGARRPNGALDGRRNVRVVVRDEP